jgi:hypothetical protein
VVREERQLKLSRGSNQISLWGMPTELQPSGVIVRIADDKVKVGDFTYSAANMSQNSLLLASRGKDVTVEETHNNKSSAITGKLVAVLGSCLVIRRGNSSKLVLVNIGEKGRVPVLDDEIPFGMSDTASLTIEAFAEGASERDASVYYETPGMDWEAAHSAFYDEKAGCLTSFETRVAISNRSGTAFENAMLFLFAGANNGAQASQYMDSPAGGAMRTFSASVESAAPPRAPSVESVGDATMYALARPTTLGSGQMQMVELFSATNVPVAKEYYLPAGNYGQSGDEDGAKQGVWTRLKINNTEADRMGKALPAGIVSIFQADSAGNMHKTGSASIAHASAGEKFKLEFGPTADIKAVRKLVSYRDYQEPAPAQQGGTEVLQTRGNGQQVYKREEKREVTIFNFKSEAVKVKVSDFIQENAEWVVEPKKHKFARENSRTASATVEVEAGKSVTVQYHIRWQR